jgi:arylsulfatase A-like enzyme
MEDNTIVVFTSDHGDCLGIHEQVTKNNWYEESVRVPLIIRYPEKLKPRTDSILLSVPDFYPTFLGLLGLQKEIPKEVDGTNYTKYMITGKGNKPASQWYMRIDNLKPGFGLRGVRTAQYTYIVNVKESGKKSVVMYDRKNDPYQMVNIAESNPGTAAGMNREMLKWLEKYNDPIIKNLK